jgi:hypothetical protein
VCDELTYEEFAAIKSDVMRTGARDVLIEKKLEHGVVDADTHDVLKSNYTGADGRAKVEMLGIDFEYARVDEAKAKQLLSSRAVKNRYDFTQYSGRIRGCPAQRMAIAKAAEMAFAEQSGAALPTSATALAEWQNELQRELHKISEGTEQGES